MRVLDLLGSLRYAALLVPMFGLATSLQVGCGALAGSEEEGSAESDLAAKKSKTSHGCSGGYGYGYGGSSGGYGYGYGGSSGGYGYGYGYGYGGSSGGYGYGGSSGGYVGYGGGSSGYGGYGGYGSSSGCPAD